MLGNNISVIAAVSHGGDSVDIHSFLLADVSDIVHLA